MTPIIELSNWLRSLKLLRINTWTRIDPTGQVLLTCNQVVATCWRSRRQYKDTAILRGHKKWYIELTLFASFRFTYYVSNRSKFNKSIQQSSHRGTVSLNSFTSCNSCNISSSQYLYGDNSGYSWLHQYPGSGFGKQWILQTRVGSVFEIHRY